jgi:Helix-turn-helix domain
VGANGDRSTSRRSKRRRPRPLTPVEAGEMLRNARESLGIELPEVHDRTGISWRNLEAIESGEVQRFSDPAAAAVAMRRYAELVSLDAEPLVTSVTSPVLALAGAPAPGINAPWAPGPGPGEIESSGHLRRYQGDQSHLRSFTQTAQVPTTGRTSGSQADAFPGGPAGAYHAPRRRPKPPWMLRFVTWFVLLLVLVGVAGISINRYEPQWLRDIHVLKGAPAQAARSGSNNRRSSPPTTHPKPSKPVPALVTTSHTGIGTATVKVASSNYTVVVAALNSCWVEAQTPGTINPIFDRTLTAGQTVSIPVTGGQVTVELGAQAAGISVKIAGTPVPGWSLHPDAVPFFATFTNN